MYTSPTNPILADVHLTTRQMRPNSCGCQRCIPVHTEDFHSGGATTLSFSVTGANTVSSFVMHSETSGNTIFVPLENTALAHDPQQYHDQREIPPSFQEFSNASEDAMRTSAADVASENEPKRTASIPASNHLDLHRRWSSRDQVLRHALKPLGTWSCRERHIRLAESNEETQQPRTTGEQFNVMLGTVPRHSIHAHLLFFPSPSQWSVPSD